MYECCHTKTRSGKKLLLNPQNPISDNALIAPYEGDFIQNHSESNFFVMSLGRNLKLLLAWSRKGWHILRDQAQTCKTGNNSK